MTGIVGRPGELDQCLCCMAMGAWEDVNTAQRRPTAATSTSPAADTRPTTAAPALGHQPAVPPAPPRPDNPRSH